MAHSNSSPIPPSQERRKQPRLQTQLTALVEATEGETARFTAQIVEVSELGMRFNLRHRYQEGNTIRIDLPNAELGPVTTVLACVMHAQQEKDGLWTTGCQFCTELDEDDLVELGVRRRLSMAPVKSDQRQHPRIPIKAQVHYRDLNTANASLHAGQVINVSPMGIGLRAKESLKPGTLLDLQLVGDNGKKLFDILACIVYRHLNPEGDFNLGCNFIRELTDDELKTME